MIKKILLAAAISAMMTVPMYAQAKADESDCRFFMELSKTVMEGRQAGVPATTTMDVLINNSDSQGRQNDLMMDIIVRAYDTPKYSTAEYKQEAADEFANGYYLDCMKTVIN